MKELIKSNPFLYELWFKLYRKNYGNKINYFDQNTKLLLDGYPRSGNTFAADLIKNVFEKDTFASHFHAIAPIKIALSNDIPVVILLRAPEEAITSNYLVKFAFRHKEVPDKIDKKLLNELMWNYIHYYEFVQKKRDKIKIIKFQTLINQPEKFIDIVNRLVYNGEYKIKVSNIKDAINTYNKRATEAYGSPKPNADKEKIKSILKEELFKIPQYERVEDIYKTLS